MITRTYPILCPLCLGSGQSRQAATYTAPLVCPVCHGQRTVTATETDYGGSLPGYQPPFVPNVPPAFPLETTWCRSLATALLPLP